MNQRCWDSFECVFYHELGHFVANILNQELGKGFGVEEMYVQKNTVNSQTRYEGGVTPKKPNGCTEGAKPDVASLGKCIATVVYGCLFQSWRERCEMLKESMQWQADEIKIDDCLNNSSNGNTDYQKIQAWLSSKNGYDNTVYVDVKGIYGKHFDDMKGKSEVEIFFKIDPQNYATENNGRWDFDTEKLKTAIDSYLNEHKATYAQFVDDIQSAIDSYQEKKQNEEKPA